MAFGENPELRQEHTTQSAGLGGISAAPEPSQLSLSDLMSALFLLIMALFMVVLVQLKGAEIEAQQAQARAEELERYLGDEVQSYKTIISHLESIREKLMRYGILVEVDEETGEVIIKDQGIFFEQGKSLLSKKAKGFLSDFMQVYGEVVLSEAFAPKIRWIVVEGNTSSEGEELPNLNLSLERAEAVAQYIRGIKLSTEPGEHQAREARLKAKLLVAGRGEFGANQGRVDERDRNVRFRLHFVGDLIKVLHGFEQRESR